MPSPVRTRGSISTKVVIAGIALAMVGLIFLMSRWADDGSVDAGSVVVTQQTAPPTTGPIQTEGSIQSLPAPAADEGAVIEQDMAAGPRDQRTASDEGRLRDIVRTTLPGLRSPTIVCAGLTCRVSGDMPTTVDAARGHFRSVNFSDAIFALGYSPGPDNFKAQGTDTAVLLYLKREN